MSQSAYARWRGVSHVAVGKAIKSNRLVKSVNADGKITDPFEADREWKRNTSHTEAPHYVQEREAGREVPAVTSPAPPSVTPPPAPGGDDAPPPRLPETCPSADVMPLGEAARHEKFWKARTAELEYHQAAGNLVPAADVREKLQGIFSECRVKLLSIPGRARQAMPHLSRADVTQLEDLIREALEALATEGGAA